MLTAGPNIRSALPSDRVDRLGKRRRSAVTGQEQTQMMIKVIGRPTPNAPPIIDAMAESKPAPACN
jgi:hypothetical protein